MSCAVCVWALGFEGSRRPSTLQCIPMAAYAFGAGSRGLRAVWACAAQVQLELSSFVGALFVRLPRPVQVRRLIELPPNVFWPGHARFARANGLGHPCFEYKVVNPYVTAYGLACEI